MSRVHSDLDIYVGDDLTYQATRVTEDPRNGTVVVRARAQRGRTWAKVLTLTGVETLRVDKLTHRWTGQNEDGETVAIVGIHHKPLCCGG